MSDDTFSASGGADDYGVYSINSTPTIRSSSITGTTYSVLNSSSTAKVANSVLNGPLGGAATFSNPQGNLRSDFTPITVYP